MTSNPNPSPDDSGVFRIAAAVTGTENVAINVPVKLPATRNSDVDPSAAPINAASSNTKESDHHTLNVSMATVTSVKLPDLTPKVAQARPVVAPPGLKRSPPSLSADGIAAMPQDAPSQPIATSVRIALPVDHGRAIPFAKWRRRVQVSARKLSQPPHCACCQSTPDSTFEAVHLRDRGSRSSQHSFTFPYCSVCLEHMRSARMARIRSAIAGWLALFVLVVFGAVLQFWWATIVLAPLIALATCMVLRRAQLNQVRQRMSATCACIGPAVRYAGFYGTVQTFDFANEVFASRFEQANASKLV